MRAKIKTLLIIIGVLVVFIALHFLGVIHPIERGLTSILNTGISVVSRSATSILDTYQTVFHRDNLQEEVMVLQNKLQSDQVDKIKLEILQQENDELKEQLHFFENQNYVHVGALVIGKGTELPGATYIIDKGKTHGVAPGNAVIVNNGLLVGVLTKVEDNYSILRLINDNESKVAVTLMGKNKSVGVVEGGYGLSVRMNFIPQNEEIKPGEIVITSGLIQGIPYGLVIGTVELVERKPHEPFQQAVLIPSASLDSLRYVSIITNSSSTLPL